MVEIKTFRDLVVWQPAMTLAKEVYKATSILPDSERFGLSSQMRRAAVSIPSNIAEGYARQSHVDYLRYLKMARGSLAELRTQVLLAQELSFLKTQSNLLPLIDETERILAGLIRSLRDSDKRTKSEQKERTP